MSDALIVGCGYVGRRLATRWRDEGRRVFATTRDSIRAEEFRADGLVPILCDVTEPDSLSILPAVETVVHAVGLDRSSGKTMREVYVAGLANLLDHLPTPRCFLHVSSSSVYGQTGGEEVDETAVTEPADESGRVVLEAERLLRERMPGAIVLRFAGIYGPGRLIQARAIREGQPLTSDPNRWLNLIHVEDGVEAVIAAERCGKAGETYNVSDGHPVRRGDFYAELARLIGAPPPRFVPPGPNDPPPRHEGTNRRIVNRRLREELLVRLRYPDYRDGLRVSFPPRPSGERGWG